MVGKRIRMGRKAASNDMILGMAGKKAGEKKIPRLAILS
jgi:hypothetical protein